LGTGGSQRFSLPVLSAKGDAGNACTTVLPIVAVVPQSTPTLVSTGPIGQFGSVVGVTVGVAVAMDDAVVAVAVAAPVVRVAVAVAPVGDVGVDVAELL
jgi:hypothetical protein